MAMTIHVDIVSAEAAISSGSATMVFAPAEMGEVGIAPRHTPMLTRLKPGEVRVQTDDGKEQSFYVSGGMLEVQPHVVTVLSDTALRAKDLDEAAALSWVGRRQEHFDLRVSTRLEFNPRAENEEAGRVIGMNERHHAEIFLTRRAGQRGRLFVFASRHETSRWIPPPMSPSRIRGWRRSGPI